MMYIIIHPKNLSMQPIEIEWHVGQSVSLSTEDIHLVDEIQVDGNELTYIMKSFDNIPYVLRGKDVVHWYGDIARFIVGNL